MREQPRATGRCPHCGYDAVGLLSNICPECGKDRRRPALVSVWRDVLVWPAILLLPSLVAVSALLFDRSDFGYPSRGFGGFLSFLGILILPLASGASAYFVLGWRRRAARIAAGIGIAIAAFLGAFFTTAFVGFVF